MGFATSAIPAFLRIHHNGRLALLRIRKQYLCPASVYAYIAAGASLGVDIYHLPR
jgi:hypothetical protein